MNLQSAIPKQAAVNARWLRDNEWIIWDRFVEQHPDGLIYQSSKWTRTLETAFPHIKGKFLVIADETSGEIRAGIPIYQAQSWLMGERILSIPFASCCNPLFTASDWPLLSAELRQLHQQSSAKVTEIRSFRSAESFAGRDWSVSNTFKHHYIPLNGPEEKIFETFSKTAVRQMIQRASKSKFVVKRGTSQKELDEFHALFSMTRKRLSLPPVPVSLFDAMLKEFGAGSISIYIGYSGDEPLGGIWVTHYKGFATLEQTGEAPNARGSGISQALYWKAIQDAIREGRAVFSLGRTAPSNQGLVEYKRRWGSVEEDLVTLQHPAEEVTMNGEKTESASYRLAKGLAAVLPEPLFQLMGRFCFRHWA